MRNHQKLTPKQTAFCENYIVKFNGKLAAIQAGYSPKTADSQAAQLLSNTKVQAYITEITKKTGEVQKNLRQRVINELELIAFSDLADYGTFGNEGFDLLNSEDMDPEKRRVLQEYSLSVNPTSHNSKIKLSPKEKALELLGRHLGLFTDNLNVRLPEPTIIRRKNGEEIELGAKYSEETGLD